MKTQNKNRLITGIIITVLSVIFMFFDLFSNSFKTTLLIIGLILIATSFIKLKK